MQHAWRASVLPTIGADVRLLNANTEAAMSTTEHENDDKPEEGTQPEGPEPAHEDEPQTGEPDPSKED